MTESTIKNKPKKRTQKNPSIKNPNLDNREFLLFVTNLNGIRVERFNNWANHYFGNKIAALQNNTCFYRQIVHPSQYDDFISNFISCKSLGSGKEKSFKVRLKNASGIYSEFLFVHRSFKEKSKKEVRIISIAYKLSFPGKTNFSYTNPTPKNLLSKQSKFKHITDFIDDAFCIVEIILDLEGKPVDYLFLETNPALKKHIKMPKPEGRTMLEIEPQHELVWFKKYGEVALSGKSIKFQDYAEHLNKTWFEVNAFPIGAKGREKVAIRITNITQKRKTEKKLEKTNVILEQKLLDNVQVLQENSELLQTVFDTSHVGIVVFSPIHNKKGMLVDFKYERVNQVIIDQYQRKDLVGKRYLKVNSDAKETGIFKRLTHTFLTGEKNDFEIHYNRNSYNNWFRIVIIKQNNLLISNLEDITHQKLKTEKLRLSVRFVKQLAKTSPDVVLILDIQHNNIRFVNKNMAQKTGVKKKEILGLPIRSILPFIYPGDKEKAMNFHKKLIQASDIDINEIEFRLKGKVQNWEWYNARGKVFMRDPENNVCEYLVILRNIQEQKRTHKALLDAEKFSIKGELARTLAHELRNPLASIALAADILKENKIENTTKYLDLIKRNTATLNQMVTNLLKSSNYTSSNFKKVCLSKIVEQALRSAGDRIYLSGIQVNKHYATGYFINADVEKLKIALLNIFINASEAMEPLEGILSLKIERNKETILLSISDNGCGIQKENQDKLFDAFYTGKLQGMGIGLSSVKSILEEHEASINVKSEPNKGTIFNISFQGA